MTLHPSDGPVTDPFFAAVRRRHPDVDLVLLPPEPPPAEAIAPADGVDVRADVRADLETARTLLAALDLAGPPEERVELGVVPGVVRAAARSVARGADASVVDALAAAAAGEGWSLRRHRGAVELMEGSLDRFRLRASFAGTTGVLLVEVAGPERAVGREGARELSWDAR